jgi:sigma-B regulation protein RsbQ
MHNPAFSSPRRLLPAPCEHMTDVLTRNNVKVTGSGSQPILFAHGFGCDQNMWRYVAPSFEEDYRVIVFDYVGSGGSDLSAYDSARYATLDGYAQDILDICEALDLHDVILVGHSVSSMVAVLAANREPERFAQLLLIGPSPRYVNDGAYIGGFEHADIDGLLQMMDTNYVGWANFLGPAIMKNPERPELAEELTGSFCSTDPKLARRFAEVTFFADNRSDLQHVRVPTLIMQCADDMIAPEVVGKYTHEAIPGSEFRQMEATGHCPHMSHPEETIRIMREYLQTVDSSTAAG